MDDGIQVFIGNGGQLNQSHPFVMPAFVDDMVGAAIDSDSVSALHQPLTQLLYTGLKATVTGRDATGAEEGNVHHVFLLRW